MIRFDAGEYQQGRNESDDILRALALGTPQESTDVRVAVPCQDCGESEYMEFTMIDGEPSDGMPGLWHRTRGLILTSAPR